MAFPLGDTVALQQKLCDDGKPIPGSLDNPTIYQLNLRTRKKINETHKIRSYQVGGSPDNPLYPVKNKVILLVGESGSGKSATINSIANYVYGVTADSNLRFQLVDENPEDNEHESQTEWVTAYTLLYQKGFKLDYTLTIVDTPGYGATQGPERDLEITSQMKAFFLDECHTIGCEYLSAICFVTKSTETRLSPAKIDIYNALLDLFSKDLGENILHVFTFAGNQKKPKALNVIGAKKEIPLDNWYLIENCALNPDNGDEEVFAKTTNTLCDLLNEIETIMDTSVAKTKEALKERDRLQNNEKRLQELFADSYFRLETLNVYKKDLELAQKEEDDTKQVTVFERVKYLTENVGNKKAINCTQCKTTCHYPCIVPANVFNWFCHIMSLGECTLCHCSWRQHEIARNHYERKFESKQEEIRDIIKRFKGNKEDGETAILLEGAVGGAMPDEEKKRMAEAAKKYRFAKKRESDAMDCIKRIEDELKEIKGKMKDRVKSILDSIKRLEEIALRPCQLKETDIIDQEIKKVTLAAYPRWEERVKILEDLKKEKF